MSGLEQVGDVVWLLPLALAAGLDLYLALLVLGAAPLLGWPGASAGSFAGLGTLPAVALAGLLYGTEILATRTAWAATAWNVVNTPIRVIAAALLCLLGAPAAPEPLPGPLLVLCGAALAATVHLARTGYWLEMDVEEVPARIRTLASTVEDVVVVVLLYLALMRPPAGLALAGAVLLVGAWRLRSHVSAGLAAHGLVHAAVAGLLERGRWREGSRAPGALRSEAAPGDRGADTLRWSPASAWGGAVPGRFRRGWLVVDLGEARFVGRGPGRTRSVSLDGATASRLRERPLCTAVHVILADGRPCGLAIPGTGPGLDALKQVFHHDPEPPGTLP